jgi:hypothetical protein
VPDRHAQPKRGATIVIDDPRGQGKGNFAIWLKPDGLSWKNYTTDEKGRSLELIAYMPTAGITSIAAAPRKPRASPSSGSASAASRPSSCRRSRPGGRAAGGEPHQIRSRSVAPAQGGLATFINAQPCSARPAEIYLREIRGIDLAAAPFIGPRGGNIAPKCLRFIPRTNTSGATANGAKLSGELSPLPDRLLRRQGHADRRHPPDVPARRRHGQGRDRARARRHGAADAKSVAGERRHGDPALERRRAHLPVKRWRISSSTAWLKP